MDHELDLLGELEPDDLEEVACRIWPDSEHTGRVGIRVEIDDDESMFGGMEDVSPAVADLVLGF